MPGGRGRSTGTVIGTGLRRGRPSAGRQECMRIDASRRGSGAEISEHGAPRSFDFAPSARKFRSAARGGVLLGPHQKEIAIQRRNRKRGGTYRVGEGAEAAPTDLRDYHHRALSATRELGAEGTDRDVISRCVGSPGLGENQRDGRVIESDRALRAAKAHPARLDSDGRNAPMRASCA